MPNGRGALVTVLTVCVIWESISVAEEPKPQSVEERLSAVEKELAELKAKQGEAKESDPYGFVFFWKDGVRGQSADKRFEFSVGGRIQADAAFFKTDNDIENTFTADPVDDAFDLRRLRLYAKARLYEDVVFNAEYEFQSGTVTMVDVFVGLRNLPWQGVLQIGHFHEPFGLEELTSDNFIVFVERSTTTAINPVRNTGIRYTGLCADERVTWSAGFFRTTDDQGDDQGDHEYSFTTRVTGCPYFQENKEKGTQRVVHGGAAYSFRNLDGDVVRYRFKPEVNTAPNFIDTGNLTTENINLVSFESTVVMDSLLLQGEWNQSSVQRQSADNPDFHAWYVFATYFLTRESHPYERKTATFGRVRPRRNFSLKERTPGAWEVSARVSSLDAHSKGVNGGELDDVTLGLTWHLNPNSRIFWNWVHGHLEGVGSFQAIVARFSIDI
ncbi:MAG: OprO/OprP family phosphate-selective porin [Planctomycetes bacterium]|nr:OprO/OprP family phosphate-selective porin [Planctomycetota bacterium]